MSEISFAFTCSMIKMLTCLSFSDSEAQGENYIMQGVHFEYTSFDFLRWRLNDIHILKKKKPFYAQLSSYAMIENVHEKTTNTKTFFVDQISLSQSDFYSLY